MRKLVGIAIAATLMTAATGTTASAGIKCQGPWQIVNGTSIASPFCGDTYLARIARTYGMRVSSYAVRWNPSVKSEVCRLVGQDNRVHDICAGAFNDYYKHKSGR